MSRIAGKEKLLYYPTPSCIVDALASYLTPRRYGISRLLDPCAGKGEALARLVNHLRSKLPAYHRTTFRTYGIEPELTRVKAASSSLDQVLQASFFSTTLSNGEGPDGGWQLCLLNPPYDTDTEITHNGRKTRLEVNFLQRASFKLCPEGILIWIVPQASLRPAAKFLASHYTQLFCVRFPDDRYQPDPEKRDEVSLYEQFHQVIVFGIRRAMTVAPTEAAIAQIRSWADAGQDLPSLPLSERIATAPEYTIPVARSAELRHFFAGNYDPDRTASQVLEQANASGRYKTGLWSNQDYLAARLPDAATIGLGLGQPLAPLKKAHLAVLSVAGIANRAILTSDDEQRQVIVKGTVRKVPVVDQYEDDKEIVERITDTFESSLWGIDLHSGDLVRVITGHAGGVPRGVQYESMALTSFLNDFGASLAEQVDQANPPRYSGEAQLPWLSEAFPLLKRQPLGKQREIIAAHVNALLNPSAQVQQAVLERGSLTAEMSTGKTFLALATAFLADLSACGGMASAPLGLRHPDIFPLIILCPPIMAYKWKREAEKTIPDVKAVVIRRMGKPSKAEEVDNEPDEDDATVSSDEAIAQFRQFDPSFSGSSLSAIGALDRAMQRIEYDLAEWQAAYELASLQEEELPRKPCHIIILTGSTAKLGMDWMPIYRLKIPRYRDPQTKKLKARHNDQDQIVALPCCPHCFHLIKNEREIERLKKSGEEWRDLFKRVDDLRAKGHLEVWREEMLLPPTIYLSEKEVLGTKDRRVKRRCFDCGEPLWQHVPARLKDWQPYSILRLDERHKKPLPLPSLEQPLPGLSTTFQRRYPLAKYIQQHYRHAFGLLIADEIHEGRDGSALNFARQRLANATRGGRMLGLTGTLSNGYAGSLFRFAYVMSPAVRRDFAYTEEERWIDLYGKRQTTRKTYKGEVGTGSSSDRRVGSPQIRELAGFAPAGLTYILPCSSFLELSDVAPALPRYEEETHLVEMDRDVERAYDLFREEATRELGHMLAAGDTSGLSAWWNGMLHYPNMPYRGWTCTIKKTGEIFGTAPKFDENRVYAKEQAVIHAVQQEVNDGRRVLLYTENTGYYDIMPRLKTLLESRVKGRFGKPLKVVLLYSNTVDPIDREAWLDKQVNEGCDVLICNPKLVKVGLDMISFPTVMYVSFPTSVSDLRQSSRRPYRIGQTQPVKVIFFVYPTMETSLLRLLALKMKASLMVEGKLPGEGLVTFGEEESENETEMVLHLAREILASLEKGETQADVMQRAQELQDLFKENAQIEQEKNQLLGQDDPVEVEFKPIVVESFPPAELLAPQTAPLLTPVSKTKKGKKEATSSSSNTETMPVVAVSQPPMEPVTVTIIQTGITSGKDPWAALREKYIVPKKKKKRAAVEGQADLWSLLAAFPIEPPTTDNDDQQKKNEEEFQQQSLW